MAWVLSGEPIEKTFAYVDSLEEAATIESQLFGELEARGFTMLLSDRMAESMVLLMHKMRWDIKSVRFSDTSDRIQNRKTYLCQSESCRTAILSCNRVDQLLWQRYQPIFREQLSQVPEADNRINEFLKQWRSKSTGPWMRKYPGNCFQTNTPDPRFRKLHMCGNSK